MSTRAFAGAAALILSTAPVAWADLTAESLWADWQGIYNRMGMTIAAGEQVSGDVLTLSDVTVGIDMGEIETEANYGTITLTEQPDGSVRVDIPAEMQISSTTSVDGETLDQTFTLTQEGFDMVVTEDGDTRVYTLTADSIAYGTDDITSGEAPEPIPLLATLVGVDTVYTVTQGEDGMALSQDFAATELVIEADGADAEEAFTLTYRADGLEGTGEGTLADAELSSAFSSEDFSLQDLGIDFEGSFSHSGSATAITADSADGPFEMTSTAAGGEIFVGIDEDGLTETFSSTGMAATVQVAQFPFPITASAAETVFGFTVPVGTSEDPKPFALDLILRDLIVDEAIWGLFDPTGQLPRDPATLVLDLDGAATMTTDIFGNADAFVGGPPGEVDALTLGDLTLSFGGAELRATGDLDFPTADVTAPVGMIDLALDGAFGLVDSLVALGILPPEQAAFAKGMAGAVTRPVGEDQLESTIEFTEGGGITANGLPLR